MSRLAAHARDVHPAIAFRHALPEEIGIGLELAIRSLFRFSPPILLFVFVSALADSAAAASTAPTRSSGSGDSAAPATTSSTARRPAAETVHVSRLR